MTILDAETNAKLQGRLTKLQHAIGLPDYAAMENILNETPKLVGAWDEHWGSTALSYAIAVDNLEAVHFLIRSGANINQKVSRGQTPLHRAIYLLRREIVTVLLDHGADLDAKDDDGNTPLHTVNFDRTGRSSLNESARITKLLLKHGADPDARNDAGRRPLHCVGRGVRSALFCLASGANPNARDHEGRTPLHEAALWCAPLIKVLARYGADVHARDADGWTPLHVAASRSTPDGIYVRYLLEIGANPNTRDNEQRTPLHVAAAQHCVKEAELLLAAGADMKALDGQGKTPLYRAQRGPLLIDDPEYRPRSEAFKLGRAEMVDFLKANT